MTTAAPTELERRLIAAAVAGKAIDLDGQAPVRGSLVREILTGQHGTLHWKGLRVRGLTLEGGVDLSYCEWRGRLELKRCRIAGDIDLTYAKAAGAIVLDDSRVRTIIANNLELTGSLQARRAIITRGFRGVGMQVAGALNLTDATVCAREDTPNRMAVSLYRAKIEDLYMTRASCAGGLYANAMSVTRNARISGLVACTRESLDLDVGPDTSNGAAVTLVGAEIGGALYLYSEALDTPPPRLVGTLDLGRVRCATLRVRPDDLRDLDVAMEHLAFERLHGIDALGWLDAIEQARDVGTQPYRHLAKLCEEGGHFETARTVRIALQHRIDRDHPGPRWRQVRRRLLNAAVAYGYRPGRALLWLAAVSVLATALLSAYNDFMVSTSAEEEAERGFGSVAEAATFAIDSLVPFARLGVVSEWTAVPEGLLQHVAVAAFVVLKGLAWAFAALALAATTGLVRRD
ncbi:MAG TPA: hypothetical protein VN238_07990 [Solirubrobacteraceae bacterium]|nr:hypothetical protein [Solirubrobacteraceae bacterium]